MQFQNADRFVQSGAQEIEISNIHSFKIFQNRSKHYFMTYSDDIFYEYPRQSKIRKKQMIALSVKNVDI